MRSINDDEEAAVVLGVNVRAVQVAAFTIGGAFTGLSGALYAHNFGFVEAQYFNSLLSIYVLLFVLIGGAQTAWGPLAGSLFFTLLPELFRIGGSWRYFVFGVLIVADDGGAARGHRHPRLLRRLSPRVAVASRPQERPMALIPPSRSTASPSGSAASTVSDDISFDDSRRRAHGADRTERRRQDDAVQSDLRRSQDRQRQHHACTASRSTTCRRASASAPDCRARFRTSG